LLGFAKNVGVYLLGTSALSCCELASAISS
jgi:hypothetical protein